MQKNKEVIFALFLSAGAFKADPRLAWLPVDLTLITSLLTVLCIFIYFGKQGFRIPKAIFSLLPFYLLFLPTMFWTEWHSYAADKIVRFFTFTLIAAIAPPFLITTKDELYRFLKVLSILGEIMAVDALFILVTQGGDLTRLTAFGSNTIALGRMVGITFLWIAVLMLEKRLNYFLGITVLGFLVIVLLGSGSRGPLLAAVTGVVVSFLFLRPGLSKIIYLAIFVLVSILVIWSTYTMLPATSLQRLESFFSGDLGESEMERLNAYKVSWEYIQENPFGVGLGGFASRVDLWSGNARQYPHNILLETTLEGGLATGFYFLILLIMAIGKSYFLARCKMKPEFIALFSMLLFFIVNAMVSGDLNDNKMLFAFIGLTMGFRRLAGEKKD